MTALEPSQVKELLNKNWMTHDAMWFFHCLRKYGMEDTNQLNQAAIRSMAQIEAGRLAQALGIASIDSLEDLKRFVEGAFAVVKADFMDFTYEFMQGGSLRMNMGECFAHQGMQRLGVLDQYRCGIYLRVDVWLKTLGVDYEAEPAFEGCLKLQRDSCHRTYHFSW
ncbi:MAG: hypothetical protein KMY53_19275 [Desulfarculus sp.]|nr:hypothetical protein [Pseudomonadota bacterium]MBV1715516.1 hypothetical protein [Desulfarculus sp.]MBU4574320.1 hypothetical protein [Pseudomonadota bacterium]MBU4599486.1 hypothetical protein [Pseudomonadota bacterium]MBV1740313.1 hypothetical protein [Desulfarculus sp.]